MERRKLWRSSGELLENFWAGLQLGKGSTVHRAPLETVAADSWALAGSVCYQGWSLSGHRTGLQQEHRSIGGGKGGHQDWIWLRGCTATKRLLWNRGGFLRKDRMCTFSLKVVFLFWNEKNETVLSGKFVFKVPNT